MSSAALDAVAGVVPRAAHPAQLPARPEIADAHFRVRLEAAAGQHHGAAVDVLEALGSLDGHADDGAAAILERRTRPVS